MKKKLYLQPATKDVGILPPWVMAVSRGWARDGNPPTAVEQEDDVDVEDLDGDGYGGFLDLD